MNNQNNIKTEWIQSYIEEVNPIIMTDPLLELLGQTNKPIPYTYEEVVKFSGHSCGAVAGAWGITSRALKELYPNGIPVRGRIKVSAPGAEDESVIGVIGEVITFITGAAPKTGFHGGGFGEAYRRRNLMEYRENEDNSKKEMIWFFERIDTGDKVSVKYNMSKIKPASSPEFSEMGSKVASGEATLTETEKWIEHWNARAKFTLDNIDSDLFTVEVI